RTSVRSGWGISARCTLTSTLVCGSMCLRHAYARAPCLRRVPAVSVPQIIAPRITRQGHPRPAPPSIRRTPVKSAVENLNPTRVKLTVEVSFEELKPNLDAAYKKIAQQINIPGFRRGKVPAAVIDRQVGRGPVLDEVLNAMVPEKYMEAMQAEDLEPLAQPEIEVTKIEDNDLIEFTAEVDVKPKFELPAYDNLEAQVDDIVVTDADVDEQVEALRERFGTLVDVERAAADGDFVTIDLRAAVDGEAVEGGEVSGMSYKVGRGGMLDGLDETLAGMSAGDEQTLASQLVGGDLVGEDVDVTVAVTGVQEQQLPEIDDE